MNLLNAGSISDFTINVASGSSYVLTGSGKILVTGDTYSSTDELIKSGLDIANISKRYTGFDGVKVNAGLL